MADTNPHNISDKTIVSLTALQRYHHQLLETLGLVHDTAAYQYKGTREDFPSGVTSVSGAIDSIYDLAKSGGVTFSAGKSAEATTEPIMFADDDQSADNIVYINAKVGDNTFNIGLDTSSFVKDSVLKSVFLLNVAVAGDAKAYKANGADAVWGKEEDEDTLGGFIVDKDAVEALAEGTYFYYTWITDNGEKAKEYQYTSISLKDVYGDINGDDTYITYDKEKAIISADTAEIRQVVKEVTEYTTVVTAPSEDAAGKVVVTPKASGEGVEYPIPVGSNAAEVLEENGYTLPEGAEGNNITAVTTEKSEWKAQVKDEDGNYVDATKDALATTDNVKEAVQTLQDQIDTLAQGTLSPGEITLSDEIAKSDIDVSNNKININIAVASEDEINALFEECIEPAES